MEGGFSHRIGDREGRTQPLQEVDAMKRGGNEEQFRDSRETRPGFIAHCDNITADLHMVNNDVCHHVTMMTDMMPTV